MLAWITAWGMRASGIGWGGGTRFRGSAVSDDTMSCRPGSGASQTGCAALSHVTGRQEDLHARRIAPGESLSDVHRLRREVYYQEQGQHREHSERIADGLEGSGTVIVVEDMPVRSMPAQSTPLPSMPLQSMLSQNAPGEDAQPEKAQAESLVTQRSGTGDAHGLGRAVGTLRIHDFGAPMAQVEYGALFQIDDFARAWPLRQVAVGTRLAVKLEHRVKQVMDRLIEEAYRYGQDHGIRFGLFACDPSLHGLFEHYGFREYLPPAILPNGHAVLRMVMVVDDLEHLRQCDSPLARLVRDPLASQAASAWLMRTFRQLA